MEDDGDPIGYEILPRGIPVVTSDGVEIGKVVKALDNKREHIFDGIVVRTSDREVFVDAPEVERLTTARVTLNIDAATAAALPRHGSPAGASAPQPEGFTQRIKRFFGR